MASIAAEWKVLSGENNWDGLLDPINDNLRYYLINYAMLTRAVNDAINVVKESKGYALCRYPPEVLLSKVGLQNGNPFKYKVTDYVYGRIEQSGFEGFVGPNLSTYIGFVAVSTNEGKLTLGRRDILVGWRGTTLPIEWFEDVNFDQVSASDIFPNSNARVHHGFYNIYTTKNADTVYNKTSARDQVLNAVRRLVDKEYNANPDEQVSITVIGHSLGAALATLNSMDIAANGYNKPTGSATEYPVTSFAFASPRVGNAGFEDVFSGLKNYHLLRIKNALDFVPDLPPKFSILWEYKDVGVELEIDTRVSPYIKKAGISQSHDLNLYAHGIAGYQGKNKDFSLKVNFDLALVNKYNDLLASSSNVPPKWWSNVINSGMAQMDDGSWKLHDYVPDPPALDVSEITAN